MYIYIHVYSLIYFMMFNNAMSFLIFTILFIK